MRKAFITGTAGFIGFHLARRLLARGWQFRDKFHILRNTVFWQMTALIRLLRNRDDVFSFGVLIIGFEHNQCHRSLTPARIRNRNHSNVGNAWV